MPNQEIEQVLRNWISQANGPIGQLEEGSDPAQWIARQFLQWWQQRVSDELGDGLAAVEAVRQELLGLGGWSNPQLGEALHELIHAQDALATLGVLLGCDELLSMNVTPPPSGGTE